MGSFSCGEVERQHGRAQPRGSPPPLARASTLLIACYRGPRLVSTPTSCVGHVSAVPPRVTLVAAMGSRQRTAAGGLICTEAPKEVSRQRHLHVSMDPGATSQEGPRRPGESLTIPGAWATPLVKATPKTNAMKRSRELPVDGSGAALAAQSSIWDVRGRVSPSRHGGVWSIYILRSPCLPQLFHLPDCLVPRRSGRLRSRPYEVVTVLTHHAAGLACLECAPSATAAAVLDDA